MPLAGKIGDRYGRKRIFLGAAVLFTTASLCCGFAGNIYLLVVLRAFQAVGGGSFMPSATGIVARQSGPTATGRSGCSPASSRSAGSSARCGRDTDDLLVMAGDLPG